MKSAASYSMREGQQDLLKLQALPSLGLMETLKSQPFFSAMCSDVTFLKL
jgi:hypothetical protein